MLKYAIQAIDGSYEGKMSGDGKSIAGTWTQGPSPLPLLFERATFGDGMDHSAAAAKPASDGCGR